MKRAIAPLIIAVSASWLCSSATESYAQKPLTRLPLWVVNHTEVLPPVSAAVRSEVAQLFKELKANAPDRSGKANAAYTEAARRLVELGELTGQAIIWDYIEEPESIELEKPGTGELAASVSVIVSRNGQKKDEILMRLGDDPTLVRWLLPMVRLRMEWFEKAIADGHINEVISPSEIAGIESYLYRNGTTEDLEKLGRIVRGMVKAGFHQHRYANYPAVAEQAVDIAEARRNHNLHAEPYYKGLMTLFRSVGIAFPSLTDKQTSPNTTPQAPGVLFKPPQQLEAAEPGRSTHSSRLVWLLVVIAATVGAVWVFLRKSK